MTEKRALRVYGRDGIAPAVGQHGAFDAGVVHLHHEGARDAGALLQPQGRLSVLVLRSNMARQGVSPPGEPKWEQDGRRKSRFHVAVAVFFFLFFSFPLTLAGQFLMWWPAFPQR